ncbi:MAG: 3-dehydroquinate synthase [Flavobacteriales bacterium]
MERIFYPKTQILFDASFSKLESYLEHTDCKSLFLLVDKKVYNYYKSYFTEYENIIIVDSEENSKSLDYISFLIEKLLKFGANKKTHLIGIGGGVICDITGFVASIFMRGIGFSFVPTTILCITDACLGGKNGVNFNNIKNIVGTINEPNNIIIDFSFLESLSIDDINTGFAEIIKHACVASPKLFSDLENLVVDYKSMKFMREILKKSISIKLNIVLKDLKDLSYRRILNFGHTYGHAIEAQYKLNHGHSVSLGIIFACNVSKNLGYLSLDKIKRIEKLLSKFNLPTDISKIDLKKLLPFINKDKKAGNNKIDFIVLEDIGKGKILNVEIDKIMYD